MTSLATPTWLSECFTRIRGARVGVFGDFFLDADWTVHDSSLSGSDPSASAGAAPIVSFERQVYLLGGAGNIAANLAALGANAVHAVGLIADDMFGTQTLELMESQGIKSDGMLRIQRDWQTPALATVRRGGAVERYMAFGSGGALTEVTMDRLADALERTAGWCDLIVINQHMAGGVCPAEMVERVNRVIAKHARCKFLVDARHRAGQFTGAMMKMNLREAAALCDEPVPDAGSATDPARRFAARLFHRFAKTVFITQGQRGILAADATGLHESPVGEIAGPTDPLGAGDTVSAALAAMLVAGYDAVAAARMANLAARVTLCKLQTTGTASPEEIRKAASQSGATIQEKSA